MKHSKGRWAHLERARDLIERAIEMIEQTDDPASTVVEMTDVCVLLDHALADLKMAQARDRSV